MAEVIVRSAGYLKQEITAGAHELIADEPVALGGADEGPDPYSLLLASLGACTSMTLQMYARRKGWQLDQVQVSLRHSRIHAKDCEACESKEGMITQIERRIQVAGPLTDEQKARLLEIAKKCPVHKTLTSDVAIIDSLDS